MTHISYALLVSCFVTLGVAAQDTRERSDLSLFQSQITAIELLANRAGSSSGDAIGGRYRFDYPRFAADLKRVRRGIHNFLSPSRAQPAELVELRGDYRAETLNSSPSDEHD